MKTKRSALIAVLVLFCGISAAYLLQLNHVTRPILTNSLFLIPPALAVISGLYTLSIYRLSSPHGQVIAYLTAGLACWLVGETIFYIFQFVTHINPFPSAADVFYLLGYPLLLIGLVKEVRTHGSDWRNVKGANKLVVALIGMLVTVLAFIVIYFGVFQAYMAGAPAANNFIAISYGIGDLILLVPVLFILKMILDFRGGKLFYSWLMILVALFCVMASDILFAIYPNQYQALVPAYTLIDLGWVAGYLLFTFSFFFTAGTIKQLRSTLVKKTDG